MKTSAEKAKLPGGKRVTKPAYGTEPGVVGPGKKPTAKAGKKKFVPFKKKGKKNSGPKIQG